MRELRVSIVVFSVMLTGLSIVGYREKVAMNEARMRQICQLGEIAYSLQRAYAAGLPKPQTDEMLMAYVGRITSTGITTDAGAKFQVMTVDVPSESTPLNLIYSLPLGVPLPAAKDAKWYKDRVRAGKPTKFTSAEAQATFEKLLSVVPED